MGWRKLCLTAGLTVVAALAFAPGALAWTFSASGSASCDRSTGEHVITWSIDNRTEPQALTIRVSNRGSVPVGSTVAARAVRLYTERVSGSTTGTVTLTVKGNWPSDQTLRTRSASVTLSAACLPDVCPNLTGVQEHVPSGMVKDAAGNCVPPPTDVCPNIEGLQTQVPSGMVKNVAGDCVTPPTDLCPNLEGVQAQLPSGMIKDTSGDCVTPPTDVCPNIEGIQTQVPSGMVKDTAGNCVTPPSDVCPNLEGVQEQVPSGMVKDEDGDCGKPPTDECPNIEGLQTSVPANFMREADGQCAYEQRVVTITVPGPERLVSVAAAPITVERVVTKVVRKVVIKRVKVARKKVKRAVKKPRVLPFTP